MWSMKFAVLLTVGVFIRQPVVPGILVLKLVVHHATLLGSVVVVWVLTLMRITNLELIAWAGANTSTVSWTEGG